MNDLDKIAMLLREILNIVRKTHKGLQEHHNIPRTEHYTLHLKHTCTRYDYLSCKACNSDMIVRRPKKP